MSSGHNETFRVFAMSQENNSLTGNGLGKCKIAAFQVVAISHLLHSENAYKIPHFVHFFEECLSCTCKWERNDFGKVIRDDLGRW